MKVKVIEKMCIGCKACLPACPFEALSMKNKAAWIDQNKCTQCKLCIQKCMQDAIVVQ